jgi:hypothetical protein
MYAGQPLVVADSDGHVVVRDRGNLRTWSAVDGRPRRHAPGSRKVGREKNASVTSKMPLARSARDCRTK